MKTVFVFIGRKRSGKDTTADITKDCSNNEDAEFLSFAGPMKEQLMELLQIQDKRYFYDQDYKELPYVDGKSPRMFMTWYGKMTRERLGDDFWTNRLETQIDQCPGDTVFITDCRFVEEIKMLNKDKYKTFTFYIDREIILGPMDDDADISETSVYETRDLASRHAQIYSTSNNPTYEIESLRNEVLQTLNANEFQQPIRRSNSI
jgi:hypothetical protein